MKHLSKIILAAVLCALALGTGHAEARPDAQAATQPATRIATQTATHSATATRTFTPSPVPTQAVTVQSEQENLFPMAIRFYVGLGLPRAKIAQARLKLFQAGVIDQFINVPINDTTVKVFGDNATGLYFPWPLTPDTAFEPFREYTFQWFIMDTDKKSYQTELYTVEYSDTFKRWLRVEEKPISIYWYGEGLSGIILRQNLMKTADLLLKNAGSVKEYKFIIYEPGDDTCQVDPAHVGQKVVIATRNYTVYPCDPTNAPAIYAARGFTMIRRNSVLFEPLQDDMIAIMTNDSYNELFKKAAAPPPEWFKSGVIQMYGLVGRSNALLLAREQARLDRLLPLDELAVPAVAKKDDFGASVRNWNAQAYMLTLYLSARFGAQTPIDLARAIGNNSKFSDELVKVSGGLPIEKLYSDWKSWLLSPDADNAIRWNLYITKPTPTVTPTETPYPTFPVMTDAPLVTDTPLPTRTRVPSATATFTNTARPPGSLDNTATASRLAATAAATP